MISLASFASSTITTPSYMTNQNEDSDENSDDNNNNNNQKLEKWNTFKETIEQQEINLIKTTKIKDSNNNSTNSFKEQEDKIIEISKIKQNEHISFDKFEFNLEINTTTTTTTETIKTKNTNKNNNYLDHLNPFNETSTNPFNTNDDNEEEEEDEKRVEVKKMASITINNDLKERELLDWCNKITNLEINDFSKSWKDGKAFLGIIKYYRPELVKDFKLNNDNERNLRFIFEKFDLEKKLVRIIDINDLIRKEEPDRLLIMTFINELKIYYESLLKSTKRQQSSTPIKDSSKLFKNRSQFTNPFDESDNDDLNLDLDLDTSSSIKILSNKIKNESFKEKAIQILNQSKTYSPNKIIKQIKDTETIIIPNDYVNEELINLTREQNELDEKAISLEKKLRGVMKSNNSKDKTQEDELIREWFLLVNRKNMLLHRQFELELL
jgi:hypothetical protein